ncbi:MAG: toprim domain-containing protein [Oscillospiraceae bacterium]|jgi:hypothetical protein|nr:toprim domain-containing protein [Oscillospiraceae bacterium]
MSGGVNREQIARAKAVPLLDYLLTHEGGNFKRVGNAYYRRDPDHNSLAVSNNLWHWHSRGIGGDIIDYLVKINGYSFVDAVLHLTGDAHVMPIAPKARAPNIAGPVERAPFRPPPRNADNRRVVEYLQGRGIDKPVIEDCISRGVLYESGDGWHNCVFIGRDERGKGRFAAMRGTTGDFKRDANGSDKSYGFVIPPKDHTTQTAAVFESPIDAMSHACLEPDFEGWRLSLGGTALTALTRFLERRAEVKSVIVCTDNDEAGNQSAVKAAELPGVSVTRGLPPNGENDWNAALQNIRKEVNPLEDVRKDIRFIDSRYNELFRVKDGENIKFTSGYDGEVQTMKCRFIDEAHLTLIGKYRNDYHICELAETLERNGSKCEPIPGQKPHIDVIAAAYGEPLKDVSIPMTEAAIKKLVGGKYTTELIYYGAPEWRHKPYAAVLRGKDGIAVLGIGGPGNDKLTSLHPYDAQTQKRELSPAQRAEQQEESLLGALAAAKAAVANRAAGDGECAAQRRTTEAR